MAYADLLRDPRWQKMRLHKLEEAKWRCASCLSAEKTLNVHHKFYRRGAAPWEYELKELEVLCEECHEAIHFCKSEIDTFLKGASASQIQFLYGFIAAMWCGSDHGLTVDVSKFDVADGLSRAFGIWTIGAAHEFGGPEWVQKMGGESGRVSPWELGHALMDMWCAAGSAFERERRGKDGQ